MGPHGSSSCSCQELAHTLPRSGLTWATGAVLSCAVLFCAVLCCFVPFCAAKAASAAWRILSDLAGIQLFSHALNLHGLLVIPDAAPRRCAVLCCAVLCCAGCGLHCAAATQNRMHADLLAEVLGMGSQAGQQAISSLILGTSSYD